MQSAAEQQLVAATQVVPHSFLPLPPRLVSQPVLPAMQCAKPGLHDHEHIAPPHIALDAFNVEQTVPQAPQLLASVFGFEQAALQHLVLAPVQGMPQPLQLSGSLMTFVQCLLQQVAPGAEPQSALATQSSQVCVDLSQVPRPASVLGQSLSALQPATQLSPSQ